MFGIGSTELLVILVVALIVLGPKSLVGVSRSLGKAIGEFRRVSTDFQRSLNVEAAREELKAEEMKRRESQEATVATAETKASEPPQDTPLGRAVAKAAQQAKDADSKQAQVSSADPAAPRV